MLTALKIKQNLKPEMYADGLGLYLKVRPGNSKSWIFRYRIGGRLRDMGLGLFHTVSLAEAREKAEACRVKRLKGLDPLNERLKEQQARTDEATEVITFEKCAETYSATHKAGWKNDKHADQWTATLQTYVYPVFKDKPIAAIDDALVLKVLQPIWKAKIRDGIAASRSDRAHSRLGSRHEIAILPRAATRDIGTRGTWKRAVA